MTPEQRAAIVLFKAGVGKANEVLEEFGLEPSGKPEGDMLFTSLSDADRYAYISQNRKTKIDISELFPPDILKLVAGG